MASNKGNVIYKKEQFPLKGIASTKGQWFPLKEMASTERKESSFHYNEQLLLKEIASIKRNVFH